jgi:hypothetical protein
MIPRLDDLLLLSSDEAQCASWITRFVMRMYEEQQQQPYPRFRIRRHPNDTQNTVGRPECKRTALPNSLPQEGGGSPLIL